MKIYIDMTQHEINQIRECIEEKNDEGICRILDTIVFQSIFDIKRQVEKLNQTGGYHE